MLQTLVHHSVMPLEVIEWLQPAPGKVFVDGTLGGAGHAKLLLEAGASVIGVDQDPFALERALAMNLSDLRVVQGNFRDFEQLITEPVDGVLLDLGVSSFQLDDAERGFSYHNDAPLDMRMAQSGQSAEDAVNDLELEDLARVIYEYGEERFSRRIARAIVEARAVQRIRTTAQLSDAIRRGYPGGHARGVHPSRRTFQALRIYVNDELGALEAGLKAAVSILKPAGRLAVISFHSLEDRIVKRFVRDNPALQALTKRPLEPGEPEVIRNPRSRSAKLRVSQKVAA